MTMQSPRPHGMLATIAGSVLVLTLTVIWLPKADQLWSISSDEVDELLYRHLDEYQLAIDRSPELSTAVNKALTSPDALSDKEINLYLNHERRFFGGWEMAFNYGEGGHLDSDRFDIWDDWYRTEMARRPAMAWTANREGYSVAFAAHVEGIERVPMQLSDCSATKDPAHMPNTMRRATVPDCSGTSPAERQ